MRAASILLLAWPAAVAAFAPSLVAVPGARRFRAAAVSGTPGRAVLPALRGRARLQPSEQPVVLGAVVLVAAAEELLL